MENGPSVPLKVTKRPPVVTKVPRLEMIRAADWFADRSSNSVQWVTVNAVLLVALPPGVVRTTFPVLAPVGTVKVTC
jgi:hypothetical protein